MRHTTLAARAIRRLLPETSLTLVQRYGFATLVTGAFLLLRLSLDHVWGATLPFILAFPAIAICALVGGLGPGVLSTVLSAFAAAYFWMEPRGTIAPMEPPDLLALVVFICIGMGESALIHQWRRSLGMVSLVLESTPDSVRAIDERGRYSYLNPSARKQFAKSGRDPEHAIGKYALDEPADSPEEGAVSRAMAGTLANRVASEVEVHSAEDDRWLAVRCSPLPDGGVAVFSRDISEERRAELSVRLSSERLSLVSNAVPALIAYADVDLVYRFCNRTYEEWFGISTDKIVGRPIREVLGEEAWKAIHPRLLAALEGKVVRFEDRLPYAHGSPRWIDATYSPHRDDRGNVVGVVILVSDISARKEAEQALAEGNRRKDEFIAVLAHELRNPLAPIRTGLEILRLSGDAPDAVARIRPMLDRQVTQITRLVDDLLDISRITSGRIQLRKESRALAELVDAAIEANRVAIEEGGLTLSVRLPGSPCLLDVDPARFVQVLSNLLHNSVKFTDRGGHVEVSGELARDGAGNGERLLSLTTTDTGVGISEAMLPRVFELFARGDNALRGEPGLGIGLALSRQLIELHGGTIEAKSEGSGRGSSFTIRMPVRGDVAAPLANPELERRRLSQRVLIIDDNLDAAESLAALVTMMGGEATIAPSGELGLDRAAEFQPDMVLLDIQMPGMDGYETCRRLKTLPGGGSYRVVALTGYGQEEDRSRARDSGFDAHLTKPATADMLLTLLDTPAAKVGESATASVA